MIGHHVFWCVRVGCADVRAAIRWATHNDRYIHQTARHVAAEGGIVEELIDRNIAEGHKHHLHNWADAEHGCADCHTREGGFGDGCVDQAFVAVFFPETFSDFVGTIVLGDFFAHDADVFVALDLFVECLLNSFAVSDEWHCI